MKQLLTLFKKMSGALVLMSFLTLQFNATAQNPVAHWKFDETTGTTAVDEMGSSNGTLTNMSDAMRVDGLTGKAIDFSLGADTSFITVDHNDIIDFDSTESFSVSALFYLESEPSGGVNVFLKGNTGVNPAIGAEGKWYTIEYKGGEIRFSVDDNVTKTQLGVKIGETFPIVGGWAHVVGVRNVETDSMYIYVNGVKIGSTKDNTDNDIASTLPLIIGNNHNKNNNFPGIIDDLRLYDTVLTTSEIVALFNSFDVPARGLVAFWKLDETTGDVAIDEMGNANGTLTNMTDAMRVDGLAGKAIDFSLGADTSFIEVGHNDFIDFDSTESFTVSGLIYLDTLPPGGKHLFIKGNTGVNPDIGAEGKWYAMETKGGELRFAVDDNVTKTQLGVNVNDIFPVGSWAHVAGVRNRTDDSLYLYLNGVKIGSAEDLTDLDISTALPLIVGNNHNKDNIFPGKMDELSIFNVALTSDEIKAMYESYFPFGLPTESIALWKFDETSGSVAKDDIGASDGSLNNMGDSLWVEGLVGNCLDFGSGNDTSYVEVATNDVIDFDSTESFSISILIKLNELPSGGKNLFIKGNTGVNPDIGAEGKWYSMETKGGEFRFSVDDNVTKTQLGVNVSDIYPVGTWAHVVGVRDLAVDSLFLYLNGVRIGSAKDNTDNDIASTLPLIIGNNHNKDNIFPGKIDELSMYSKALSQIEVYNLYKAYAPPVIPVGSVAYWKLNESSGTTAKDEFGISDGTLHNMSDALWVPGLVGNCLNFAGGSDSSYVEVISNENIDIDSTTSFSISVLVTTADINVATDQNVLFKGYTSNAIDGHWYGIIFKNNELRFAIDDKVTKSQLARVDAHRKMYLDGGWNHIVGVRDMDKDTLFIYLNGEEVASMEDVTELNISTPLPLIIGNNPEHNVNFEGKIDDLMIFNRALSAEVIAAMTTDYGIAVKLSDDANLSDLKIDGTTIPGFSASVNTYDYEVAQGAAVPVITATASDENALVEIVDATAVPGTGTVTVTAENSSQLVYTVNYTQAPPSAVSDAKASSGLNIYPNPAGNRLFIENESEISSITIYNTNGIVMNSLQDVNSKTLILDLDELNDGLYLVKVITVYNDIISMTFMKK